MPETCQVALFIKREAAALQKESNYKSNSEKEFTLTLCVLVSTLLYGFRKKKIKLSLHMHDRLT